MTKDEAMSRWRSLTERLNPLKYMKPIPYRAKGSKYGADSIRISGSPKFIDSVLSNLTGILEGECNETRLTASRTKVKPNTVNGKTRTYDNASEDAEVMYILLHERGRDAKGVNVMFDVYNERGTDNE